VQGGDIFLHVVFSKTLIRLVLRKTVTFSLKLYKQKYEWNPQKQFSWNLNTDILARWNFVRKLRLKFWKYWGRGPCFSQSLIIIIYIWSFIIYFKIVYLVIKLMYRIYGQGAKNVHFITNHNMKFNWKYCQIEKGVRKQNGSKLCSNAHDPLLFSLRISRNSI
jgi:hypothetical protein